MPQNLTGFDAALKDVYGPAIQEELSQLNVLTEWIDENDTAKWDGRQVTYPIHVGRNEGVGASTEGQPLPTAGSQSYATVKIPEKYNYGRIELTGQVIKSSQTDKGSFARAMESELRGMVKDMSNDRERQFFGYGNGVLALVNAQQNFNATVTMTIDSQYGIQNTIGGRFLNPNMLIAVINASTPTTVEGTFTVATINAAGTAITISATTNVTVSDNAYIVRCKPGTATGTLYYNYGNEVMGLLGLIDDGTYVNTLANVNRTTYPVFKSTVISSVGNLSLDVVQRAVDATDELGGGFFQRDGVLFCHHSVRREYLKLLQPDRRYTGAELKSPDGSPTKLSLRSGGDITFADRPIKVAKHAPYGTMFGFVSKSIVRYIHVRGEWADEDERILRNVSGYDKWEAFYRIYDNLHTDRPNDAFRLDGITSTVAIAHVY